MMELAAPAMSYQDLLDAQRDLFMNQIERLQDVVATQCKLTGVNPLSQEMAAGALSIKIGKRPRDLLNPKAVKYMQSVFSIKDAISKRETREISAHFGVTLTQVRDFFMGQRARVRKFVRLSKEKDNRSCVRDAINDEITPISHSPIPVEPLPLDTIIPTNVSEGPSCSKRPEVLSGMEDSEVQFVENIFSLMRKEESYAGQVKLLQWILRMENPSVLHWFLTEGGLMILATWLSETAKEEQTSFLHVVLKLLDYLPLRKAHPGHMSAILQSVNRLRFYRTSDISHRARNLLSKWSNMFGKNLSKKSNGLKSASDLQSEMLLKQSINEVLGDDSWDLKAESSEEALKFPSDRPDNLRKLDMVQPLKMLTAPGDDSNKRRGVLPSQTREKRRVQMVEQPGQRLPARSPQVAKSTHAIQSRPLSADDIQKAKMRAQFMQNKHGKTNSSPDDKVKPENQNQSFTSNTGLPSSVSKSSDRGELEEQIKVENEVIKHVEEQRKFENDIVKHVEEQRKFENDIVKHVEEQRKVENDIAKHVDQPLDFSLKVEEEPPWKKCKRLQIPWRIPSEVKIMESWSVGNGAESKELEVQKNRIRREREIVYRAIHEIPSDPREPWDHEMDFDDTLTPVIPIEQLPDDEPLETPISPKGSNVIAAPIGSTSSDSVAEPDFELLAELLKNPDLVYALTSGQTGGVSSDATVKLLDMIKAKGANSLGNLAGCTDNVAGNSNSRVEVSLPSPTPSTDSAPNGPRPDFTRNPFSRLQAAVNGSAYQALRTTAFPQGGMVPSGAALHSQIPVAPQPSAAAHLLAHKVLPVPSLQTNIQLAENWKAPASTNPQMHLQTSLSNSFNTQYMTTEMILNANTVPNTNWASSSIPSASSIAWSESLGKVKPSPPSVVKAPSQSLTPPHSSKPTESPYLQESVARNSLSTRQGFESKYGYTNSRIVSNYNAYGGGPVEAALPRGNRGGREYITGRPGYESWSPDNSPSRRREHSSNQYYHEPDANSRHGYGATTTRQNVAHPSRYEDHNVGSAGHRRWRDYNR